MSGITITGSVTINRGVYIGAPPPPPVLKLSLDASTYNNTTTSGQQNVSGTSDNVGFFPYAWPAYGAIQPGWTCVQTGAVVSAVDGTAHTITTVGTPFTSGTFYSFTNENTWFDSVNNLPFILYNGVTYSSDNGGILQFVPGSSQYAQCSTSLSNLNTWTVEAWHYYTGTNAGSSPCVITEVYTGGGINYALGSLNDNSPALMAGWYNGGWNMTGYTLTPNRWYQIVGTYDGKHVKLYVNNTLVEQVASTGTPVSSGSGIRLMERWDNPEFWGGSLGIVNVYENAMTAADVNTSWLANRDRFDLTPPTLDITGHTFGQPTASVTFNITNNGGSPITEAGVIWGLPGHTTYAISVDSCVTTSTTAERKAVRSGDNCANPILTGITGSQTVDFSASEFLYESINAVAYAINSFGISYSPTVLTWVPTICLAEGTLITLADGTSKAIENIEMFDNLKVWDFDNGVFATANPLWIKQEETTSHYNLLTFSDGSTLKTYRK